MKNFLFLLIGFFLLCTIPVIVNAEDDNIEYIYECKSIGSTPKNYFILKEDLTYNPTDTYDACLKITGVGQPATIDCQGHEISSTKKNLGVGIHIFPPGKINIINCKIRNFYSGVYISDNNGCKILNNRIYDNEYGIQISDSVYEARNHEIVNNTFIGNKDSILLRSSYGNKIYNNTFESGKLYGYCINSMESGDNLIYNNLFKVLREQIYTHTYNERLVNPPQNDWSLPEIEEGKRIYGPGKFIGGNYYDDYELNSETTQGYSNTCEDKKSGPEQDQPGSDCICDLLYLPGPTRWDKYPLANCWNKCPNCCYTDEEDYHYKIFDGDIEGTYSCSAFPSGFENGFELCRYTEREKCEDVSRDSDDGKDYTKQGTCTKYKGICTEGECGQGEPIEINPDICSQGFDPIADLNKDGKVNIMDITVVATKYGSKLGDPKYSSNTDLNKDGIINILDITVVARDYGKQGIAGLMVEYYVNAQGRCVDDVKDCSELFKEGSKAGGAEWTCKEGTCVGCDEDSDCYKFIENPVEDYPGLECYITHCNPKNECLGSGHYVQWYCDNDYCKYTDYTGSVHECSKKVEKGNICINNVEIPVDSTNYCKKVPFCEEGKCKGEWHYAACNGEGQCDESAATYFAKSEVMTEAGKVLDENCDSVPVSSSLMCADAVANCPYTDGLAPCIGKISYPGCDGEGNCDSVCNSDSNYCKSETVYAEDRHTLTKNCESTGTDPCDIKPKCLNDCDVGEGRYVCYTRAGSSECSKLDKNVVTRDCGPYDCYEDTDSPYCTNRCDASCFDPGSGANCDSVNDCTSTTQCNGVLYETRTASCSASCTCSYGTWTSTNCALSIQNCDADCSQDQTGITCGSGDCTGTRTHYCNLNTCTWSGYSDCIPNSGVYTCCVGKKTGSCSSDGNTCENAVCEKGTVCGAQCEEATELTDCPRTRDCRPDCTCAPM